MEIKEIEAQKYISIRESFTDKSIIAEKMGIAYGELMAFLGKKEIKPTGSPIAIYHKFSQDTIEMESAFPIVEECEVEGRLNITEISAGTVAMTTHWGDYNLLEKTYELIEIWLKENNKTVVGSPWEIYVNDPQMEKDTNKWQTDIYFPIE